MICCDGNVDYCLAWLGIFIRLALGAGAAGPQTHSVNTDDSHSTCDTGDEDYDLQSDESDAQRLPWPQPPAAGTPQSSGSDSLAPLWCHQPPDLRLTTRSPRLMSDIRRPSSMTSNTMSHELLRVPLRQQRRYQSLSIRNGPSKASSNTAGSGMM
jgi:hypothetical protein